MDKCRISVNGCLLDGQKCVFPCSMSLALFVYSVTDIIKVMLKKDFINLYLMLRKGTPNVIKIKWHLKSGSQSVTLVGLHC